MNNNYDYLQASDGYGDAALMTVQTDRQIGSTDIDVDVLTHVPQKFLATSGPLLANGFIDPQKKTEFRGHISGEDIIIDGYELGSTDIGHKEGDVIVIRPNTGWTNRVANVVAAIKGVGDALNVVFGSITATSLNTSSDINVGGNLIVSGTSRVTSATITTNPTITPTSQIYNVTALANAATINTPSFAAADGMAFIIRIKDNGTAQGLTFPSGWSNVSGLATPTTTVAGKLLTIGALYSVASNKWEIQGINNGA